ncbi:hypothetical protein ETD83_02300 [Actinomadura soli]|uniref:CD-NTase-associated protein 16 NUDIX domain-containing protein n=1 Tax=Actinomadura soli TaxID=2508997 RepID=A0A5C4JJZ5_9ACTN|nr:hypothetical protein [Actinomadura soli]TMR06993.1 hypothetical protein ETD83_02300 [Actinomadura soli]
MRAREVRISFSALVRIRDDDRHVLLHSPSRPGVFNPPGGVYKHFGPAARLLESWGFRPDRPEPLANDLHHDLRGFLPGKSIPAFERWFLSGAYRESATECLRRELAEELNEVELPHLVPHVRRLTFSHLRTTTTGPEPVAGKDYLQLRRFEVHDLCVGDAAAHQLRIELVRAGADVSVPLVICATSAEIRDGRHRRALIGGHAGFLSGDRRYLPDLPMIRE